MLEYRSQNDELQKVHSNEESIGRKNIKKPSSYKTCMCITWLISADNEWNPSPAVINSSLVESQGDFVY